MRKTTAGLVILFSCFLLLNGCGTKAIPSAKDPVAESQSESAPAPEPGKRDELIPFEEGQLYAAAYLGYQKMDDWDYYEERYLDKKQPPTYHISDGDFYLIIPRYPGMILSLFAKDMETGENVLNCEEPDCGPFIVQCNVSEIFADAVIQLSYQGETIEYSPCLSGEDGSLVAGEYGLDITKPGGTTAYE